MDSQQIEENKKKTISANYRVIASVEWTYDDFVERCIERKVAKSKIDELWADMLYDTFTGDGDYYLDFDDYNAVTVGMTEEAEGLLISCMKENEPKIEFANDELALELNHGNCWNEGRHPDTNDSDWELFKEAIDEAYSEDLYNRIQSRLASRK